MRLYIADDKKLTKFDFPKEIEESFLVTYKPSNSKKEYTITIEAKDGFWYMKSNGLVNAIENGQISFEVKLFDYCSCQIEISGDKIVRYIYCLPSIEKNIVDVSTFNLPQITLGNSNQCNICVQNNHIVNNHIIITNSNNTKYTLTTNHSDVYVNNKLVATANLKVGDVVFLHGFKFIWMGNFIRINNPTNTININGMQNYNDISAIDNTKYEKSDSYDGLELYKDEDYFYHTPRIRNYLTEEKVSIDAPPQEEKADQTPVILTIGTSLTMAASSLMMGYNVYAGLSDGKRTFASSIPQIVMCVCMIIGSLIMPRVLTAYNKKQKKKKEKLRQEKYGKYLSEKEEEIKNIINSQASILNKNYPSPSECANIITNKNSQLWERQMTDDDFLTIDVGLGNCDAKLEITAPEKHFSLEEDNLQEMVYKVVNNSRKLENVPITYSLIERKLSAIICDIPYKSYYINNVMLQLATLQSALDVKFVLFIDEANKSDYEYAKNLPHIWSEDKKTRYYANNISDMKEISEGLEKILKERQTILGSSSKDNDIKKEKGYKNFSTYYLIITDSYRKIKDFPLINQLLKSDENYGFSILFIDNNLNGLPPKCSTITYALEKGSYIVEPAENNNVIRNFELRKLYNINMQILAGYLSNIPIAAKEGQAVLPKRLSFLEMYNVSKIEQLNILSRWRDNNPVENLKTPIGVHADRDLFMLDLHEKAHGPHGLIAGSTGSGKSEFIITFVLSMAVNFHPEEVQFVLIDYKGGGLAGAFENREKGISLPHLAGTITNLDTAEMNRTLVSINSELKRRQRMFNEVRDKLGEGTIDIYKYQKLYREGKIEEPIAHLFIISDEFAELKSQQPDFMDELISTSRIGRSLGVHLILATQKPSGVVNDQIWANSKFKICLKVQDRGDSMEMLKRPEAASLKEAGRFYLQVGYDEYFDIGQSGYSGVKYIPSDRIIKKVDDSINYINDIGKIIKTISEEKKDETIGKEEQGDQLTNVVKYIVDISKKQKIKIKKLWLSSIPEILYLDGLKQKYDYVAQPYYINPIIGEYDNPSAQEQGLLTLDISGKGHSLIYGMTGSGKENLLTTLVYSTCINHSPEEVNFYIMDFGAETLKIFNKYPHVGGISTISDEEQIINTFVMIDEEAGRRKALFTDYAGSYSNYIKESGEKLPLIVIIINSFEVFNESFSKLASAIIPLIRDGSKYGIIFIVTTSTNNSIGGRTSQLFLNKISLQQPQNTTYRDLLNSPKGLAPKKFFGRGIVAVDGGGYEFQTAYICEKEKVNQKIRETGKELNEKYKTKAVSAVVLPEIVTIDMLEEKASSLSAVPIGLSKETKECYKYDFEKNSTTMILSDSVSDKTNFVSALCAEMSNISNIKITCIDALNVYNNSKVTCYKNNFDAVLLETIKEINKEADGVKRIFFIFGLYEFKKSISPQYSSYFDALFDNISKFKNSKIIFVDNYESFKNVQIENWYINAINSNNGIWLGKNVENQILINFNDVTEENKKEDFTYMGFVCEEGEIKTIKYIVEGESTNE